VGRDFPPVQTGPEAHPASCTCTMGTGYFPGVKYGRGVLLTTHPPGHNRACNGNTLPCTFGHDMGTMKYRFTGDTNDITNKVTNATVCKTCFNQRTKVTPLHKFKCSSRLLFPSPVTPFRPAALCIVLPERIMFILSHNTRHNKRHWKF
jgi:hypothetical protein